MQSQLTSSQKYNHLLQQGNNNPRQMKQPKLINKVKTERQPVSSYFNNNNGNNNNNHSLSNNNIQSSDKLQSPKQRWDAQKSQKSLGQQERYKKQIKDVMGGGNIPQTNSNNSGNFNNSYNYNMLNPSQRLSKGYKSINMTSEYYTNKQQQQQQNNNSQVQQQQQSQDISGQNSYRGNNNQRPYFDYTVNSSQKISSNSNLLENTGNNSQKKKHIINQSYQQKNKYNLQQQPQQQIQQQQNQKQDLSLPKLDYSNNSQSNLSINNLSNNLQQQQQQQQQQDNNNENNNNNSRKINTPNSQTEPKESNTPINNSRKLQSSRKSLNRIVKQGYQPGHTNGTHYGPRTPQQQQQQQNINNSSSAGYRTPSQQIKTNANLSQSNRNLKSINNNISQQFLKQSQSALNKNNSLNATSKPNISQSQHNNVTPNQNNKSNHNIITTPKGTHTGQFYLGKSTPFHKPQKMTQNHTNKLMDSINFSRDNINNQSNTQQQQQQNNQYEEEEDLLPLNQLPYLEQSKISNKPLGLITCYSANTHQGLVRNYNEDRVSIILNMMKPQNKQDVQYWPTCSFFGIYDGHGGSNCAEFLRDQLHYFIIKDEYFPQDVYKAIKRGFEKAEDTWTRRADQEGALDKSGSCAIVVMLVDNMCYSINLGDSRAILSEKGGLGYKDLSYDHKPQEAGEEQRITSLGGKIYQSQIPVGQGRNQQIIKGPFRVLPGRLAVSRTMGDVEAKLAKYGGIKNVISAEPDIMSFEITDDHDFIILACDGIFDKMNNKEVIECCWNIAPGQANQHEFVGRAIENVMKISLLRKSFDNVTAVVIGLKNIQHIINNKKQRQPENTVLYNQQRLINRR